MDIRRGWPQAFGAAAVLIATGHAAMAECQASDIHYDLNTPSVRQSLRVTGGEPCGHFLHTHRDLGIVGISLTTRATHGIAAITHSLSNFGYAYSPKAGFVGSDHFAVSVQLQKGASTSTMAIDVDVEVANR